MQSIPNEVTDPDVQPPFFFQLATTIGKPFGLRWVRDNHVRAVYRMESYFESRGPLFFWINGWKERLGPTVYIGPRFRTFVFSNLSTSDPMHVGLRVSIRFTLDPRKMKREIGAQLINLNDDVLLLIIEGAVLKSIRPLVANYSFEEIRLGQVFDAIDQKVGTEFVANPSLAHLGMQVGQVRVLEPILSDATEKRLEQTAQRRYNIQATQDFDPSDIARSLAIEIVEKLNSQGLGEQYLNTGDILSVFQQLPGRPSIPTKTINGQAVVRSDAPDAQSASTSGVQTSTPSSPSSSTDKGPLSPSFLDDNS